MGAALVIFCFYSGFGLCACAGRAAESIFLINAHCHSYPATSCSLHRMLRTCHHYDLRTLFKKDSGLKLRNRSSISMAQLFLCVYCSRTHSREKKIISSSSRLRARAFSRSIACMFAQLRSISRVVGTWLGLCVAVVLEATCHNTWSDHKKKDVRRCYRF